MIKYSIYSCFLLIVYNFCYAQTDTIYTNNQKISCTVKQVTPEAVVFVYPNEDVENSVYINTIQKIAFRSGRIQYFSQSSNFKPVRYGVDWQNVTISQVESEVNGLFKLGDVGSHKSGFTTLSSSETVKEKALIRMKMQAALMGGNIVYLTYQSTKGNQYGTYFQAGSPTETSFDGIAYTNVLPSYDNFIKLIGNRTQFDLTEEIRLGNTDHTLYDEIIRGKSLSIDSITNVNGFIMITCKVQGDKNANYRVIYFNDTSFIIEYENQYGVDSYKVSVN